MSDRMPLIGPEIMAIITTGLYDNPLAMYREYIQNSADAIEESQSASLHVDVHIEAGNGRVTIRDNGPGLSYTDALGALLPVAMSQKSGDTDRGFRGIGRLAALAFSDSVSFATRTHSKEDVTRITWNGGRLRANLISRLGTERTIRESVDVRCVGGECYPNHFFEVEIVGVKRHAAGLVLNPDIVRSYISEVCPVPLSSCFPFASRIRDLFERSDTPFALEITVNGVSSITRPYGSRIMLGSGVEDDYSELEEIQVPSVDGGKTAAVGWVAHSSYLGAIPKGSGVRCIRARSGNIQIGDENVFDSVFSEERFNRWCIGEIHILDPRIVPNGRRDYFEPGPHLRNLENRLGEVFRGIGSRCRELSSTRNKTRRIGSRISELEDTYDLAISGYLTSSDANSIVRRSIDAVGAVREEIRRLQIQSCEHDRRLSAIETRLLNFRVRRGRPAFGRISGQQIDIYRRVFGILTATSPSPRSARQMIEAILCRSR